MSLVRQKSSALVSVDIPCDLMDENETGYVWTFLREARDPELIQPGAMVVAGDQELVAKLEIASLQALETAEGWTAKAPTQRPRGNLAAPTRRRSPASAGILPPGPRSRGPSHPANTRPPSPRP